MEARNFLTRKKDAFSDPNEFFSENPEQNPFSNHPDENQLTLDKLVISSTLANRDSQQQAKNILDAFNINKARCFQRSSIRGYWIDRDEFLLGDRNRIPELANFDSDRYIARILSPNPNVVTKYLGVHKQNSLFYGAHGSYVLNVPVGKYAKAFSGNLPQLYGPGPHVIHNPLFRFDSKTGLSDQATSYITHGKLIFLRVPSSKMAKIWIGSEPFFLASRIEPYVFNTPFFRLDAKNNEQLFFDATERLMIHGALKRIIPHTTEVAITYDNGILQVIEPRIDAQPTIINSSSHEVIGFLNTGLQTLVFPSEEVKNQRRLDNSKASADEIAYELFTTRDSLKVGVKLMVAYQIDRPQLALSSLRDEAGILTHIENLATVDMGKAIQQYSSQEFLCFYQTKPLQPESSLQQHMRDIDPTSASAPPLQHFQDIVVQQLSTDLRNYGITLVRLNIEAPKIMDAEIAKKMSEQALKTADANANEAVLELNYKIAEIQAKQAATTRQIEQDQKNEAKISQAKADLQAAELIGQALVKKAEAEKQAAELMGNLYQNNPKLYELKVIETKMDAFAKAHFLPPQIGNWAAFFGNALASFNPGNPVESNDNQPPVLIENEKVNTF